MTCARPDSAVDECGRCGAIEASSAPWGDEDFAPCASFMAAMEVRLLRRDLKIHLRPRRESTTTPTKNHPPDGAVLSRGAAAGSAMFPRVGSSARSDRSLKSSGAAIFSATGASEKAGAEPSSAASSRLELPEPAPGSAPAGSAPTGATSPDSSGLARTGGSAPSAPPGGTSATPGAVFQLPARLWRGSAAPRNADGAWRLPEIGCSDPRILSASAAPSRRSMMVRALRVAASSSPVSASPASRWKALKAFLVIGPMKPSIGPGSKPSISSCCCTSKTLSLCA